jgi:hypothetical protein
VALSWISLATRWMDITFTLLDGPMDAHLRRGSELHAARVNIWSQTSHC